MALGAGFWVVLWLSSSFYSVADGVCPATTTGLCDAGVFETITETVVIGVETSGNTQITTTTTTTDTQIDTVTHGTSGDLLDTDNGFVSIGGDQENDVGGKGSATQTLNCRSLGTTDKCSGLTSTSRTTYEWNNINTSKLEMEGRGGRVTYSVAIDVDADDTASITMTALNYAGETVLTGTDLLSDSGTVSVGTFEGGFDFSDRISSISITMSGVNYGLTSSYAVFDDLSATIYWNILSSIIMQSITSVEDYLVLYPAVSETEVDIIKDIFINNDVEVQDDQITITPINEGPAQNDTFESVSAELELLPIEIKFEIPTLEPEAEGIDVELVQQDLEKELETAGVEPGPKIEEQEKAVIEGDPTPTVSDGEVKEAAQEPKVVVKVKVKKATDAQKNAKASKIVAEMGKDRYDSNNQTKTLIIMSVLGDNSLFSATQPVITEPSGFFTNEALADAEMPAEGMKAYLFFTGSNLLMNEMIDAQFK